MSYRVGTLTSLVAAAIACLPAMAAANLVGNGGFETVNTAGSNGSGAGYWVFNAGNASISSWTITAVSVDIVNNTFPVFAGTYALDLVGTPGPGGISQNLATSNGLTHTVNFKARWTGSSINQSVNVDLGGAPTQTVVLGIANVWHDVTVSFASVVGNSNAFSLSSLAGNTGSGSTFIDDVSVTPVPEPASMAALGLGAAALLRRRRLA